MAILAQQAGGRRVLLGAETTVGRSSTCVLRVRAPHVSSVHASLRWTGSAWFVIDLGSRNGTWVDGQRLEEGERKAISAGARLAFGRVDETWVLADAGPPVLVLQPHDEGEPLPLSSGLVALPNSESPRATVFLQSDGSVLLESEDGQRELRHEDEFEVAGRRYTALLPQQPSQTTSVVEAVCLVADLRLSFKVSQNEEHVELNAALNGVEQPLKTRVHHYLLVVLARQRLEDRDQGVGADDEGWVEQGDLCDRLQVDLQRLNTDIYRIRKQFAELSLIDPTHIIERRFDSKEVRIGTGHLRLS